MKLGGFQKVSLLDFPNRISTVVFTSGCAFRCGYCFNPKLALACPETRIDEEDLFTYLRKRKGLLEGVVVSGGEPTLQPGLCEFIRKVKELGFEVKLDTCGYFPDALETILDSGLIDYVAMDIKAPIEKYSSATNVPVSSEKIRESIRVIFHSGVPYEFRSTLIDGVHTRNDVIEMAKMIAGARAYYLQRFRFTSDLLDPSFREKRAPSESFLSDVQKECGSYVDLCEVR